MITDLRANGETARRRQARRNADKRKGMLDLRVSYCPQQMLIVRVIQPKPIEINY